MWREQLIGYFLGQVKRDDIFTPLRSLEAFESSSLNRIGMISGLTYNGIRCEANFYDALLQDVTGDPASRGTRFLQALQRVIDFGRGDFWEYALARYLLSHANAG